ncbi:PREDICTED: BURP domain-containing protein 3-like [Fragaria vesca subsp. vesca]|uniref:BURP domain-containing protein 3-like n=1 Tax=Fragaria vesca subsp. vesca TaxID=101020 RepID=UPI0002C32927|nr:PREDICTED: BURP domain-containing protein 3-like [Fragaria vesca subsp. vesca]
MRLSFASSSLLILPLLLVLLIAEVNSARKITIGNGDEEHLLLPTHDHDHSSSSSNKNHMDPSLNVFFNPVDLRLGKTMPIYFSKRGPSVSPKLLSKQEADSIPFSTSNLPYLLEFFSFLQDSPQAKAIEYTLTQCDLEPIKGESRFCGTSLESMVDFATALFGSGTQLKVLTTSPLSNTAPLLQNYTVLETPNEIHAPRMIGCHTMPYPYAVFYCHSQESENKLFQVWLGGENGERIHAAAVCHMDTSQWDSSHVAFQVLGAEPGTSPVCHFFPSDNLVWVPSLPA